MDTLIVTRTEKMLSSEASDVTHKREFGETLREISIIRRHYETKS
jgi:hypothetical protein